MKSEIIAVGSEMLTPFRQDTNSLYLTEKLNELGVTVAFKTIVGDRQKDLVNAITRRPRPHGHHRPHGRPRPHRRRPHPRGRRRNALPHPAPRQRSGRRSGRTRRHMAHPHARQQPQAGRRPRWRNPAAQPQRQRSRPVARHTWQGYRKLLMLVPGPPNECRPLFDAECMPRLREILPPRHIAKRTLRAAMIPESQADKLLAPIYTEYKDVETTILANAGDIQLTLLCSKPNLAAAQAARRRAGRTHGRSPRRLALLLHRLNLWSRSSSTISACAKPRSP
jgi:nicotinamide-nucleotide amidase